MRNIYLSLVVVAALATTSCEKNTDMCCAFPNTGKYELRTRTGGIAGETKTYSPGNGNAYLFETGSDYKLYTDGQLSKSGSYKITQDSSVVLHQPASRIIFDSQVNAMRTLIKFSSNKMTIQEDVYDGRTYEYEKVAQGH